MRAAGRPLTVGCGVCGAKPGEPCLVTLSETPEKPLSIEWYHRTREAATVR